jgi:hypothetical protein
MMLIYGILNNKPSYLMPYFSIKVFQVVIACLTTLGFYSCLPDIKAWLNFHRHFPLKDELLKMNTQTLELLVFTILFMAILVKLYVVIIVWYCYRYMITVESFRTLNMFSSNVIAAACSRSNSIQDDFNLNTTHLNASSNYKFDDETFLYSNSFLQPPKYDDIIKQIKIEQKQQGESDNNNNNNNNHNEALPINQTVTTLHSPMPQQLQAPEQQMVSSQMPCTSSQLNTDTDDLLTRQEPKPSSAPPAYSLAIQTLNDSTNA